MYRYENLDEILRVVCEMCFFNLYFLIVHISSNNVLGNPYILYVHLDNIHLEETVSQIFYLSLKPIFH